MPDLYQLMVGALLAEVRLRIAGTDTVANLRPGNMDPYLEVCAGEVYLLVVVLLDRIDYHFECGYHGRTAIRRVDLADPAALTRFLNRVETVFAAGSDSDRWVQIVGSDWGWGNDERDRSSV